MRLPNCTAGPWLFNVLPEQPTEPEPRRKTRTLLFSSLVLSHEHSRKGHPPDDNVPSPRECIYRELLINQRILRFGECDAPAIGHGQSSLIQNLAISLPQMIPRFERYLRFRSPANSLEEAFWRRNVAYDES